MEVVLGAQEMFKEVDILIFLETWEHKTTNLPVILGFHCIGSIFNEKRFKVGRGFGGIAIYTRQQWQALVSIEHKDVNNQFMVAKLHTKGTPSYLVASYYAPLDMHIYTNGLLDRMNPFHHLIEYVHIIQGKGDVWMVGDFNARVKDQQVSCTQALDTCMWSNNDEDEESWSRCSLDLHVNQMAPHFLRFGSICGLRIMNGIARFPHSSGFTFSTTQGSSIIDYLLASPSSTSKIIDFRILPPQPESPHLPLLFHLNLSLAHQAKSSRKCLPQPLFLDPDRQAIFRANFANLLATSDDQIELPQLIAKATSSSFLMKPSRKQSMQVWFDEECALARVQARSYSGRRKCLPSLCTRTSSNIRSGPS